MAATDVKDKFYCKKCGKWMGENSFFTYKDGSKTEMCKECLTMHKDPSKLKSSSVFGRYLSKMKLKQWKQYG